MVQQGCVCFGRVAAGHVWEMDFPMAVFSGQHMFSQRLTAGKHMASFRRAVATCATDRHWKYKDCKWSYAENTHCAVSLFTFYLFAVVHAASSRLPWGPAASRRRLAGSLSCTFALNLTLCFCSSLNILLISRCPSFSPFGRVKQRRRGAQ